MSGHRRAARPVRRRGRVWAAGGALAGVVAVCVIAAALAFRAGQGRTAAPPATAAGVQSSPMNSQDGPERDAVPDACTTLSPGIAASLAPGADRTEMSQAAQSDQHSECAWSQYGVSTSRQLTVELRAIAAQGATSATGVAVQTFADEWQADRSGRDLADTATVRDSRGVSGVGEQAYIVYTVDTHDRIGEAVANTRLANILVTVHYSGGDKLDTDGRPLSDGTATNGALSAARDIISKLESHS